MAQYTVKIVESDSEDDISKSGYSELYGDDKSVVSFETDSSSTSADTDLNEEVQTFEDKRAQHPLLREISDAQFSVESLADFSNKAKSFKTVLLRYESIWYCSPASREDATKRRKILGNVIYKTCEEISTCVLKRNPLKIILQEKFVAIKELVTEITGPSNPDLKYMLQNIFELIYLRLCSQGFTMGKIGDLKTAKACYEMASSLELKDETLLQELKMIQNLDYNQYVLAIPSRWLESGLSDAVLATNIVQLEARKGLVIVKWHCSDDFKTKGSLGDIIAIKVALGNKIKDMYFNESDDNRILPHTSETAHQSYTSPTHELRFAVEDLDDYLELCCMTNKEENTKMSPLGSIIRIHLSTIPRYTSKRLVMSVSSIGVTGRLFIACGFHSESMHLNLKIISASNISPLSINSYVAIHVSYKDNLNDTIHNGLLRITKTAYNSHTIPKWNEKLKALNLIGCRLNECILIFRIYTFEHDSAVHRVVGESRISLASAPIVRKKHETKLLSGGLLLDCGSNKVQTENAYKGSVTLDIHFMPHEDILFSASIGGVPYSNADNNDEHVESGEHLTRRASVLKRFNKNEKKINNLLQGVSDTTGLVSMYYMKDILTKMNLSVTKQQVWKLYDVFEFDTKESFCAKIKSFKIKGELKWDPLWSSYQNYKETYDDDTMHKESVARGAFLTLSGGRDLLPFSMLSDATNALGISYDNAHLDNAGIERNHCCIEKKDFLALAEKRDITLSIEKTFSLHTKLPDEVREKLTLTIFSRYSVNNTIRVTDLRYACHDLGCQLTEDEMNDIKKKQIPDRFGAFTPLSKKEFMAIIKNRNIVVKDPSKVFSEYQNRFPAIKTAIIGLVYDSHSERGLIFRDSIDKACQDLGIKYTALELKYAKWIAPHVTEEEYVDLVMARHEKFEAPDEFVGIAMIPGKGEYLQNGSKEEEVAVEKGFKYGANSKGILKPRKVEHVLRRLGLENEPGAWPFGHIMDIQNTIMQFTIFYDEAQELIKENVDQNP
eukprot:UC4_evm2s351